MLKQCFFSIASRQADLVRNLNKGIKILLSVMVFFSSPFFAPSKLSFSSTAIASQARKRAAKEDLMPLKLSLLDAQNLLLGKNISLQLAYEKLYQARKNIIASRAMFFPDATWFAFAAAAGPAGAAYVGGVLLGAHMLSIPSKWFDYKAIKEMARAEEQTLAAVKRNLWLELTQIYYHIYKDQTVLAAITQQCRLHREVVNYVNKSVEIGASTDAMLIEEQRSLSDCQGQEKAFEGILAAELAELRMLLNIDPRQEIILDEADLAPYQNNFLAAIDVETLARSAVYNSPEVKQLGFLEEAAMHLKKSADLSILTFSGLGFGYTGRVKIAKSQVRVIKLSLQELLNEIRNQVYATYQQVIAQIEFSNIVATDYQLSQRQLAEAKLRYEDNLDSFKDYAVMQKRSLQAAMAVQVARILVQANYAKLAAEVGYPQKNGGYSVTASQEILKKTPNFTLKIEQQQDADPDKVNVTLFIDAPYENLFQIESVTYKVQTRLGGFGDKIAHALESRFAYEFKTLRKNRMIDFSVRLHDGQIIHKTVKLDLRK